MEIVSGQTILVVASLVTVLRREKGIHQPIVNVVVFIVVRCATTVIAVSVITTIGILSLVIGVTP